jgi:hypothetical protein
MSLILTDRWRVDAGRELSNEGCKFTTDDREKNSLSLAMKIDPLMPSLVLLFVYDLTLNELLALLPLHRCNVQLRIARTEQ